MSSLLWPSTLDIQRSTRAALAALAFALASMPATAADFWGGSIDVTSDYLVRGLSLTDHQPAVQADLHYHAPSGWMAGVFVSNVDFGRYVPATFELDAYLGYSFSLTSDWAARLQAVHYAYPGNSIARRYEYDELTGAVAYRNRLFLTVSWFPDMTMATASGYRANRSAFAYELAIHQPIRGALSGIAGVGYCDLREVADGAYGYWNAGFSYSLAALEVDAAYIGTSNAAKRLFIDGAAADRGVVTLIYHF